MGTKPSRPDDPSVRKANLRRAMRLFGPERSRLSLVLGLIVVSSALGMVPAFLLRDIIDQAIPEANTDLLALLAGGMVAIAIVVGVMGVAQTYLSNRVGQEVIHELRADVYEHLQRQSLAFFTRTRTGEVQSRIANDIGGVDDVVTSTATSVVSNITTVLAAAVAMFLLDWRLAILSFVLVPFFVLLTRRVGQERRRLATARQETLADISSLVQESLSVSGVLLGKTMGRGPELAGRFRHESRELAELEVRQRMAGRWVMATISASFAILPALVYWAGGWSIANGLGAVSIGTLVAFATIQTRIFFPIGALLSVGIDVHASLALFDRIFEYLDLKVDIAEHQGSRAVRREDVRGEVSFDDVWFRYEQNGGWTVAGATFLVAPGTHTAVVGETGSGKTTLGYLVARLYDAERGSVRIDGVDVKDLAFQSLADLVGVVSQETYLFHASVRDNLRFACPEASNEQIEEACRAARIHDHIGGLSDGYDTIVGERGYRFSGGEKQRIAIARTILRNPPILVLDEATSALDIDTERQVQQALDALAEGRTTITIAHRLSTVRDADQILVLDHGAIIERGTHADLVAQGGRYADFVVRDSLGITVDR